MLKFIGIDGCKAGWIVALIQNKNLELVLISQLKDVLKYCETRGPKVLIDIPIGLLEQKQDDKSLRKCDEMARAILGKKRRSVFEVPCKQAVYINPPTKNKGWYNIWHCQVNAMNKQVLGSGVSIQSLGIVPKIREADELFYQKPELLHQFVEAHPEICFKLLKGDDLHTSKKSEEGLLERKIIIKKYLNGVMPDEELERLLTNHQFPKSKVALDDILDAICLAIHSKLGHQFGFVKLGHTRGANNIPMKISYAKLEY